PDEAAIDQPAYKGIEAALARVVGRRRRQLERLVELVAGQWLVARYQAEYSSFMLIHHDRRIVACCSGPGHSSPLGNVAQALPESSRGGKHFCRVRAANPAGRQRART